MPKILGVLETVLYVDDFARACPFYEKVLGLSSIYRDQRLCAYDVGGRGVLLLFLRGHSLETVHMPGGTIPPHDGHGPVHIAFSIAAAERAAWEARLAEADVAVEAAPPGRAAAKAFISAIPTVIWSNWRRRDCGRDIESAILGFAVDRHDGAAGDAVVGRGQKSDGGGHLLDLRPSA